MSLFWLLRVAPFKNQFEEPLLILAFNIQDWKIQKPRIFIVFCSENMNHFFFVENGTKFWIMCMLWVQCVNHCGRKDFPHTKRGVNGEENSNISNILDEGEDDKIYHHVSAIVKLYFARCCCYYGKIFIYSYSNNVFLNRIWIMQ